MSENQGLRKDKKDSLNHWPVTLLGILASFVSIFLPLFLVRTLSMEEMGQYKIFFLYVMIVPSLSMTLGLLNGLAYWAGDEKRKEDAYKASFLISYLIGFLILIFSWIFSPFIIQKFGISGISFELFSLAIFAAVVIPFFDEAAIASGRIWLGSIFNTSFELLRLVVVLFAAFSEKSLEAVLIAHTSVMLLRVFIGLILGVKFNFIGFKFDVSVLRSVISYAGPVSLSFIFAVLYRYSDQILLSTSLDESEFALYSMGCLMLPPLFILEHSVTRVLIPKLSQYFKKENTEPVKELFAESISQLAWILVPVSIALMVYAEPIIEILLTKNYLDSAIYLRIFAISYIVLILPYDSIPRAIGNSRWILNNLIFFGFVSILFSYIGLTIYGALGALFGIVLAKLSMRSFGMLWIRRHFSWGFSEFLPLDRLKLYILSSLICVFLAVLSQPLFETKIIWFLVTSPVLVISYFYLNHRFYYPLVGRKLKGKPSVMMLTQYLGMGGLERMILNLSRSLKSNDQCHVRVFTYDQLEKSEYPNLISAFRDSGIEVDAYKKENGFSLKAVKKIVFSCKENRIQVIHSHDLGALIYAAIAKIFLLGQVRIVHTQHSFVHLRKEWRYKLYERFFTLFVDDLTVVSEDNRRKYQELGLLESKIHFIPNGVSFSNSEITDKDLSIKIRKSLLEELNIGISKEEIDSYLSKYWMICIGRIDPVKGQRHLIDLWGSLSAKLRKESLLFVIGPESTPGELEHLIKKKSLAADSENIIFTGSTERSTDWLMASDIFLSASEFEGMPLSSLEAIGSGLPAVISRISGHEMLTPYSTQFDLNNLEEGAEGVNAHFQQYLSRGSKDIRKSKWLQNSIIRRDFSLEKMSERYFSLYKRSENWA
jgi:O-antigen/teichoic acid export membrane protein/glycosyltransferase involved in cell wall biosynthesis